MVRKFWKLVFVIPVIICLWFVLTLDSQPTESSKIILEMKMVPVEGSPGEFVLEYSNGVRELLKKDGKRYPLSELGKK
jgi:hypothetical protein